jgi:hypothetical protein
MVSRLLSGSENILSGSGFLMVDILVVDAAWPDSVCGRRIVAEPRCRGRSAEVLAALFGRAAVSLAGRR